MSKVENVFELRNSKYLFGFSLIPEIGSARFEKICQKFDSIEKAWKAKSCELEKIFSNKTGNKIYKKINSIDLEKELLILEKEQISFISPKLKFKDLEGINTDFYPEKLSQIPNRPFIIFAKGEVEIIKENQISIIGSRRPTFYGKQVLEKIGPDIASSGLIITSGMAMGIDSLAHKTALDNNQPTIAVLGNGLSKNILKKSTNYSLSQEILKKNGLLISEYPPLFPANKFTFPARNRIISGLSLGVLIVEAAERSGTLITARHALEQNREVLVIPGSIFSVQSSGTNKLIKQGATPITSSFEIFESLNWKNQKALPEKQIKLEDAIEKIIYSELSFEPEPLDKLILKCKLDISTISVKLSIMELKGLVKNINGGYVKN